jgi:hypothetical protein
MGFSCTAVCRASLRVVAVEVHAVLLAAAQGGRALVAAGEGGEYRHLQTQCRADERLPGTREEPGTLTQSGVPLVWAVRFSKKTKNKNPEAQ